MFQMKLFCWTVFVSLASRLANGSLNMSDCNCEDVHAPVSSRIYNGISVDERDLRYQVVIFNEQVRQRGVNFEICDGILLNSKWALTNARCVQEMQNTSATWKPIIVVGVKIDLSDLKSTLHREILKIHFHPAVSISSDLAEMNNIALIQIKDPIELGQKTKFYAPCTAFVDESDLNNARFIVPGHGSTGARLTYARMKERELGCGSGRTKLQIENTICIESEGEQRICEGDLGGPVLLVQPVDSKPPANKLVLIGIVRSTAVKNRKNSAKCSGNITIVELIHKHENWINSNIEQEFCAPNFRVGPSQATLIIASTSRPNENLEFPWLYILLFAILVLCISIMTLLYTKHKKKSQISGPNLRQPMRKSTGGLTTGNKFIKESAGTKKVTSQISETKAKKRKKNDRLLDLDPPKPTKKPKKDKNGFQSRTSLGSVFESTEGSKTEAKINYTTRGVRSPTTSPLPSSLGSSMSAIDEAEFRNKKKYWGNE